MKKFFAVLAAVCLVLGVSGCTRNDVPTGQEVQSNVETAEIKTIEPPEDGWTSEQLEEVIYINGVKYNYPISLNDLGKDFSSDENLILYKNQAAFGVSINDNGIYDSLTFSTSINNSELSNKSLVSVNGVTLDDNMDDLLLKMGKPTSITEKDLIRVIYDAGNLKIIYILNEEDTVNFVILSWGE